MAFLPRLAGEPMRLRLLALVSSLIMLWFAFAVWRDTDGRDNDKAAKKLFAYSILHLFLLFGFIVIEHTILQPLGIAP